MSSQPRSRLSATSTADSSSHWVLHDPSAPLAVGFLLYDNINQIDLTGPYEVLSRVSNSSMHVVARTLEPVMEERRLLLTPTTTIAECPALDMLVVPGGRGQQAVMENEEVLAFLRAQSLIFSVCTGALLCGAAGLLLGRRATTHWAATSLLHHFGAAYINERVVVDGPIISAAGVTAGIDGALRIVGLLRGAHEAGVIELAMEYAPEPPLACGTPDSAPPNVLSATREKYRPLTEARDVTARRIAVKLGIGKALGT